MPCEIPSGGRAEFTVCTKEILLARMNQEMLGQVYLEGIATIGRRRCVS